MLSFLFSCSLLSEAYVCLLFLHELLILSLLPCFVLCCGRCYCVSYFVAVVVTVFRALLLSLLVVIVVMMDSFVAGGDGRRFKL